LAISPFYGYWLHDAGIFPDHAGRFPSALAIEVGEVLASWKTLGKTMCIPMLWEH